MYFEREKVRRAETVLPCPRQILVTISPILCKAIKRSYQSMCRVETILSDDEKTTNILFEEEDDEKITSNSFLSFSTDQFPLIVTYKALLFLLDNSLKVSFFSHSRITGHEVNFERYDSHYYTHCHEEVKRFDANFLFTEIISNIKGSLQALQSSQGFLSEAEYLFLSNQRSSNLSEAHRKMIYAEFLKYETLKSQYSDYDILDIVHYVYRQLQLTPLALSSPIDSIFVDEVQDLTPAQIALFKFLCKNQNGYVFAGDTAQTIAPGVGFRFESVKDVFYHEIFPCDSNGETNNINRVPNFYHLKQNFRTHSGVVDLANTVVELLVHFFPQSIDKLEPEFSLVEGPLPIYLSSAEDILSSIFSSSSENQRLQCGFGAEQVILVRDEVTKAQVKSLTGNNSLVLTVLESKGMEFTDCLVYNFFSSSVVRNEWRALYNLIDPDQPHPKFNHHAHSSICTELKLLYVLLTRSRRNLVIFDEIPRHSIPLFELWRARELVNVCDYDENIRNIFVRISSPEEWRARGKTFLDQRQFSNARMCYHNSGDLYLEKFCEGGEIEQKADKLIVARPQEATNLYKSAAEIYLQVPDQEHRAAKCFELGKEFHQAGDLYVKCNKHESAASCYVTCNMYPEAIEAYIKCGNYLEALACCKKLGYFEKSLEILDTFADVLGAEKHQQLKNEWLYKAAISYNSKNNKKKAAEFVSCFDSPDEKRKFYDRYHYFEELRKLSFEEGKFEEIGLVYERQFEFLEAAECYQRGNLISQTYRCLLKIIRPHFLNPYLFFEFNETKIEAQGGGEALVRLQEISLQEEGSVVSLHALEARFLLNSGNLEINFSELTNQTWSPFQLRYQIFQFSRLEDQEAKNQLLEKLHSEISVLINICNKLLTANNLQIFTKAEMSICVKLFDYFELIPNHSNPIHATLLRGLKGTFPDIKNHFPTIADASNIGTNVFQLTLNHFARYTKAYFINLYFHWSDSCTSPLWKILDNQSTELTEKYQIALFLLKIFSRTEGFDEEILSQKKQIQRKSNRRKINSFFFSLVSSTPMTSSNSAFILASRQDERILSLVLEVIDDFATDCGHRETFIRSLILSDLTNTQRQTAIRLQHSNEERVFRNSKSMEFLKSSLWQNEKPADDGGSSLPASWSHGEFLYSIDIGVNALLSELWELSINNAAWGGVQPTKETCMSPNSFLDLVEKYYVWLQLCAQQFHHVIFPSTLLRNVVCRKSTGYAQVIRSYQPTRDPQIHRHRYASSNFCRELLHTLVTYLLKTLVALTPRILEKWVRASTPPTKQVGDVTELMHSFTRRLVILMYNYILNMSEQYRHKERNYNDIKFNLRKNLKIFSPSLLKDFFNFEISITNLPKFCVPFFKKIDSPLECFDLRLEYGHNPRLMSNQGIRLRGVIVVDSENCVSVVPPQPSVETTHAEGVITEHVPERESEVDRVMDIDLPFAAKSENAAEPPIRVQDRPLAQRILRTCREYLQRRNSPSGLIQKSFEKIFLENGVDIDSPQTYFYLLSICPVILSLREARDTLERQINKLTVRHFSSSSPSSLSRVAHPWPPQNAKNSYEEAEEVDLLHNQLSEFDFILEQLLSPEDTSTLSLLREKRLKMCHIEDLLRAATEKLSLQR
jgi:DNA polymerase III delta prime subunit